VSMSVERESILQQLARQILAVRTEHPVRVALDGIDAAGKTFLGGDLAAELHRRGRTVIQATIDGFHQPRHTRYRRGPLSADGYYEDSFDLEALREVLLDPLGPGGDRRFRTAAYDVRADLPVQVITVQAAREAILLFDGIFLQREELSECWDYVIFVDIPFPVALERALVRDLPVLGNAEAVRERYEKRYFPAQRMYLERFEPRLRADAVVENRDPDKPMVTFKSGV
jgi:uridine kinase